MRLRVPHVTLRHLPRVDDLVKRTAGPLGVLDSLGEVADDREHAAAREAKARRLMLTHLWPTIDPLASAAEAAEQYGDTVSLAAPHQVTHI